MGTRRIRTDKRALLSIRGQGRWDSEEIRGILMVGIFSDRFLSDAWQLTG